MCLVPSHFRGFILFRDATCELHLTAWLFLHLLQNLLGRLKERLLLVHIRVLRRFAVCLLLYDFHFQQFSLLPIFFNLIYLLLCLVDRYSKYISLLLEREA